MNAWLQYIYITFASLAVLVNNKNPIYGVYPFRGCFFAIWGLSLRDMKRIYF